MLLGQLEEAQRNHPGASLEEKVSRHLSVSVADAPADIKAAQQRGAGGRQLDLGTYTTVFKVLKLLYHISTVSYYGNNWKKKKEYSSDLV